MDASPRPFLEIKFYGILICMCLAKLSYSQNNQQYDSINARIEKYMVEDHVPGFIYAIVRDSGISYSKSFGMSSLENQTPITIDGIMNIGSVSKTFTATAAMQLWEKGVLDLYVDVNEYLDFDIANPSFPNTPITVFHILTHNSSIIDGIAYDQSYACGDPAQSLNDWIISYLTVDGVNYSKTGNFGNWSPGTKTEYSNVAFGLLGLIVENISKQPFNEYCRENIFLPLEMNGTGWFLNEIDSSKHISPYNYIDENSRNDIVKDKSLYPGETEFAVGSYVRNCLYSFPNYPDGLVRTSVRELSNFMIAMMNGGQFGSSKILKKETIDYMLSTHSNDRGYQGLCWVKIELPPPFPLLWGHGGADPGIATDFVFDPKNQIGVISFRNRNSDVDWKILRDLYKATAEDN